MPLKDYFTGGRSKHPKTQSSQSAGAQYKNTNDRVGTVRYQDEDSPWNNMSILPAIPIVGALYKEWTFYDSTDTSLTDVWTETKQGAGTVLGLLDNAGGGATFTADDNLGDFNWYESKQEVVQIREGKDTWIEAKLRLPDAEGIEHNVVTIALAERLSGSRPINDPSVDSIEIVYWPWAAESEENSGIYVAVNESGARTFAPGWSPPAAEIIDLADGDWHTVSVHIMALQGLDLTGLSINATHTIQVYIDDKVQTTSWLTVTDGTGVVSVNSLPVSDTEMAVCFSTSTETGHSTITQVEYIKVLQDE